MTDRQPPPISAAMTTNELHTARKRMAQAAAECAPAEVIRPLMLDVAALVDDLSPAKAAEIRRSADTLLPMFGMRAETEWRATRWWRRRRYQPPDYDAILHSYRSEDAQ